MEERRSTSAATAVSDDGDWTRVASEERPVRGLPAEARGPHGAIVGTIVGFVDDVVFVTYPGQAGSDPVACRTTVDVTPDGFGRYSSAKAAMRFGPFSLVVSGKRLRPVCRLRRP